MTDPLGQTGAPLHSPGDVVAGRYRLIEEIGRGGYAIVYRAFDSEIQGEIALKTIRPVTPRPQEALARFRREAELVSKLKHPNTVRLMDYGMEGDVYIAMELLKGRPLATELDGRHRLPVDRAVAICCEVLKSLAEAHTLGIVHRDLKPENVFLVENPDGSESVKVLDFGIAKLTKEAQHLDPQNLTLQGRAMGTPNYMSPEQAKGHDLTAHSDLYTVGVLLFEMIVGKPPYAGGTAMEIMLRHVNDPVPRLPQQELRNTPIERAIRKAMAKDPVRRFTSASEMLAALGGVVAAPVGELTPAVALHHEATTPAKAASPPPALAVPKGLQQIPPRWHAIAKWAAAGVGGVSIVWLLIELLT